MAKRAGPLVNKPQPLPPPSHLGRQLAMSMTLSVLLLAGGLGIGVLGYHLTEGLSFVDSLLDASMILTGMGPVHELKTTSGKLFASGYALFSGVFFLTGTGIFLGPLVARFLHRLHLDIYPPDP